MSFEAYAKGLQKLLRGRGRALVVQRQIDSTHLLARRITEEHAREETSPPALDMLAWTQSSGVGRGGHLWSSPEGAGIYATQICPHLAAEGRQFLPLRVAVVLCDVLNQHLSGRCQLKWPNDLMVDGHKLGGVLIDVLGRGADTTGLVSFGVNVFGGPEIFAEERATSVEREGGSIDSLQDLAEELLRAVEGAVTLPVDGAEIVEEYRSRSLHQPGDRLRCRVGAEDVYGEFRGFDKHGFLLLSVEGEVRRVAAGEVTDDG